MDNEDEQEETFELFNIYPAFIRIPNNTYEPSLAGVYSLYSSENQEFRYVKGNIELNLNVSVAGYTPVQIKEFFQSFVINVYTGEYTSRPLQVDVFSIVILRTAWNQAIRDRDTKFLADLADVEGLVQDRQGQLRLRLNGTSLRNTVINAPDNKLAKTPDAGSINNLEAEERATLEARERATLEDREREAIIMSTRRDKSPTRAAEQQAPQLRARIAARLAAPMGVASSAFGNIYNLYNTLNNIHKTNRVQFVTPGGYTIDNSQDRRIEIANLPTFNAKIGVGGVAMLVRYFQFLDAVHDLCDRGRGIWGQTDNRQNVYRNLGEIYADDIIWMLTTNFGLDGKRLVPSFDDEQGFQFFLKCICLKPFNNGTINDIRFFNYRFTLQGNNANIPNVGVSNYIPSTETMNEKSTWLLKKYLNIDKINPSGSSACTNSLFLGLKQVVGYTAAGVSSYIPGYTTIEYHMDAESNKTKICGVMQRICDAVSDESRPIESRLIYPTTVRYSPNSITTQYDAAWAQASNNYISRLQSLQQRQIISEVPSPNTLHLTVTCNGDALMDIQYVRTEIRVIELTYMRLFDCIKEQAYKLVLEEMPFKHLQASIYQFHNSAIAIGIQNLPQNFYIPETLKEAQTYVKKVRGLYNSTPKIITQHDLTTIYNMGFPQVTQVMYQQMARVVTLTIDRMYKHVVADFEQIPNAINPIDNSILNGNQNISLTSSLEKITSGLHYISAVKTLQNDDIKKAKSKNICLRGWFKSLGDLGQVLEFHTKTRHRSPTLSYMPIFLTFDRMCANLSIFFNPLTILEDPKEKTGLVFYKKKTGLLEFGKVNNRVYTNRVYNRQIYNISKRLKLMSHLELKNKLKSVGIKITKNLRGKRKYLTRKELENKALLFNKLQNTAKRMKIKLMYKSRNGLYKYKTYKRLQKEINSKKINRKSNRKYKKPLVRNFNFG
jgi:hypothetical protein